MGVLDKLMRRSDGVRRFSLTGSGPAPAANGAPPAGVAVMPQALRGADAGALRGADTARQPAGRAAAYAATLPLSVVAEVAARAEGVVPDALGSVPVLAGRPAHEHGYAVLDVVTSGPSPERDRVLEVAVVQLDAHGAVVGEWTSLLRPSVTCPGDSLGDPLDATPASAPRSVGPGEDEGLDLARLAATAGASLEELATAPTLVDVAGELVAALAGRVLVAHGASSDLAHLRGELAAVGVVLPVVPVLCTLEASWRHLPGLHRRRLVDCCRAAGVALDGVPTALTDARAAAGLLQRYLARSGERGEAQAAVVARAAAAPWPEVEVPPMSSAAPRTDAPPSLPSFTAPPGRLAVALESLALDGPDLPLPAVAGHVELLADALAAGPLDDDDARALALLADAANLTRAQVRAASRGVVLALAAAVGREATTGEAEREELLTAARVLAVDVDDVLAALHAAAVATGSMPVVPGGSGRGGRRGASGGAAPGPMTQALAAVRVPAPRVDGTARPGAHPASGEADAADSSDAGSSDAPTDASGVDAAHVDLTAAEAAPLDLGDPAARAAVRAWARGRGVEVSPRGRLPRAVVDAFQAERAGLVSAR